VSRVEFSQDGGESWADAELVDAVSPFAWHPWRFRWDASRPGDYQLCVRARDVAGNVQPLTQDWNLEGVMNNAVQRVHVKVGSSSSIQTPVDSP